MSSDPRDVLRTNRQRILERIRAAEQRAGRDLESCRLLAVVKGQPDSHVEALLDLGQIDIAENRVQAILERGADLLSKAKMHLIGHLQSNKVKKAAPKLASFQALDSLQLAASLDREMIELGRVLPVYLQVNVSDEAQKYGCPANLAATVAIGIGRLSRLKLVGLMGMAAMCEDPEEARPAFQGLARLSRELREQRALPEDALGLSMGMSHDFEVAVEEGATVVRVGSALFDGLPGAERPSGPKS